MKATTAILFVVLLCLLQLGCTFMSLREEMTNQGYDVRYIDGFEHGTISGKNAEGSIYHRFTKNTDRYQSDNQYQQGWDDGYDRAKIQYRNAMRDFGLR